jgi:uroporphyrin-III C-methyltransferase / precorrin-2 dehydrogenase / sirohydrochlorin ferrochelatase
MSGLVSLVGAGPGDPELLTLRAVRRLNDADLVLYDALVPTDTLAFAARARRFYVGKRAGRASIEQDAINRLMIRDARRGHRVVRLKCGDPFVFGRGGEEALALAAAGIACEIVPGLTTAVSAPALAGIPVTHRGLASAFLVVSGHAEAAFGPVLASLAPHSATVVVMMGLGQRAALVRVMAAAGWATNTPAAVLLGASTPAADTWYGSLGDLGHATLPIHDHAPGTIVIGAVAGLAIHLNSTAAESEPAGAGDVLRDGRTHVSHG